MNNLLRENGLEPEQMLERTDGFSRQIAQLAAEIGLDLNNCQADHIALRINQQNLAESAHQQWLAYGDVISQAEINGRPIIVIEFFSPIRVGSWEVECLELPYPAKGKLYPQPGWEHIEFVISSEATTAEAYLDDLRSRFPELDSRWSRLETEGISTKLSSPKGEHERLANPTVAFKRDGVCIKLHPHSLKDVVQSEQLD